MKKKWFRQGPEYRYGFRVRYNRGWALFMGFVACIVIPPVNPLLGATVQNIRFSSTAERTRIVLDVDRNTRYSHRTLSNPARVLIALENSGFAADVLPFKLQDGTVRRIRLNSLSSGRVQIVLDLSRPAKYETFALSDPPRIVIDVAATPSPNRDPVPAASQAGPVASEEKVVQPAVVPEQNDGWLIAIDAGHGGDDPGCEYHGLREKEIVLALGRQLQASLNKKPGFEAFMVRKGDYLVPLTTRRRIAEKEGANLFVSVHCNASPNVQARGTEVFFLSLQGASDQAAHELAERENAADEMLGLDLPEGDLEEIVFDMVQTDIVTKSQLLAESSLDELVDLGTVFNRGVKQAGFVVLKSPRIPSILVEAGFLSNRDESRLLADKGWQQEFGRLLALGIEQYCLNTQPGSVQAVR